MKKVRFSTPEYWMGIRFFWQQHEKQLARLNSICIQTIDDKVLCTFMSTRLDSWAYLIQQTKFVPPCYANDKSSHQS